MVPSELLERASRLAVGHERAVLGLAGPPGAGKSTLAAALVQALGDRAALVPLDGFHLDDAVLDRLGCKDRKGAPETFDATGYVALLRRLHARTEPVVYAPAFRRDLELAVAGAVAVPREVGLVVTEGNYLLLGGAFAPVRPLLAQAWFLDVDPELRRARLLARHVAHGRTPEAAGRWIQATDEPNARLVESTRAAADLVVRLPQEPADPARQP